jgi:hypothetical protein
MSGSASAVADAEALERRRRDRRGSGGGHGPWRRARLRHDLELAPVLESMKTKALRRCVAVAC